MGSWFALIILILLSLGIFLYSKHLFLSNNFPTDNIIYTDHGDWKKLQYPLYDPQYHLLGKPDYLVIINNKIIPIEIKSTPSVKIKPYKEHVIQLLAYCYLIEQTFAITPPYGELHYPENTFFITYNDQNKKILLNTLKTLQEMKSDKSVNRNHENSVKCRKCGYKNICDQNLA